MKQEDVDKLLSEKIEDLRDGKPLHHKGANV